jgi:PKD domain-containing protein
MDRRSDHPELSRSRSLPAGVGAILAAFLVVSSVVMAAPAFADGCKNGRDPVTGQCTVGGTPPPTDGGGGNGGVAPVIGQTRTAYDYRDPCDDVGVGCGVLAPCPGKDPVRYNVYTRPEVYTAGGWVPQGPWQLQGPTCIADPVPQRPTEQQVRAAIVEFGLPGGSTELNPPGGRTLLNLPTNFYTERGPVPAFDLPVGAFTVQVRADPESYVWHFGDNESRTTSNPGAAYPDGSIMHTYTRTGTYQVSVTVNYTVQWQFGNDGWQTIAAPIQARTSPTAALTVVDVRSVLSHG